jgi:hypothetical protein
MISAKATCESQSASNIHLRPNRMSEYNLGGFAAALMARCRTRTAASSTRLVQDIAVVNGGVRIVMTALQSPGWA